MTRILVFGAGGVGITYAYILEKGGADVTAVCRSNYETAKASGFRIQSKLWGEVTSKPAVVASLEDATGAWDFIVVCSKAFPGVAVNLIKPAVSKITAIILAQNGIGIEEEYRAAFPQNTLISGVVYLPVTQVSNGVVEHGPLELFEIGTYPTQSPAASKNQAEHFASIFTAGGGTCKVYDDIQPQRWSKVMVNASLNSICALSLRSDADFFRSSEEAEQVMRDVMHEVLVVAHALGYTGITEETLEHHMDRHIQRMKTQGKEPSMLTDVRHNRPLEVDAILGNTLRIARQAAVKTPMLSLLYALTKGLNKSIEESQGKA